MKRLALSIVDALRHEADTCERIWVLDGDLGDSYGLYDAQGRPVFPRFIQAGIAEQAMVGVAAGLAATGQWPWVFSFSAFLCHRAADQIRTCVASQGLPVVMVGSHAGAASGTNGASHASLSDLGVLASIGGIELWAPADAADIEYAVASLLAVPRPAYIRTSREPVGRLDLPPGVMRDNGVDGDVVLLSCGYASHWAEDAVRALATEGVALPWRHVAQPGETVLADWLGSRTLPRAIVTLEDHGPLGGLADTVRRVAPAGVAVRSLCWPAGWHGESGAIADLRRAHGLDTAALVRRLKEMLT
jgi:transketolase